MEPILQALLAAFPSSVRDGDRVRLTEPGGAIRLFVPRAPWDPQLDMGLLLPFVPALDTSLTLDACHLRTRFVRTVDAIEAARNLAEGKDVEANANVFAVEAARQLAPQWAPYGVPSAWIGPGHEDLLRMSANAAPADAEPLLALCRVGAFLALGNRAEARVWMDVAANLTEPRLRKAMVELRAKLADA